MNNKGFSLVELLGSLVILAVILGIGLYSARGTLAFAVETLNNVSRNEIRDAAEMYILENPTTWINNGEEYACLDVVDLIDGGYFEYNEVMEYRDSKIRLVRDTNSKVIVSVDVKDDCE